MPPSDTFKLFEHLGPHFHEATLPTTFARLDNPMQILSLQTISFHAGQISIQRVPLAPAPV